MGNNPAISAIFISIVLPHTQHNKFCDTRQVADAGAASLVEPCRTGALTVRGVTTLTRAKSSEKLAIQLWQLSMLK